MSRTRSKFYGEQTRPPGAGEQPDLDLGGAARLTGLQAEIALLRALIKRAVQANGDGEARRQVQVLCGALRMQQLLDDEPASGDGVFDRAADDEIRRENELAAAEVGS